MRVPLIILAAALGLAGCKNSGSNGNAMNVDENMTAANIVSNDVTAIDAVTGDAANMAADVDVNYGNLEQSTDSTSTSQPQRRASSAPKASAPADTNTTTPAVANTTTNAE